MPGTMIALRISNELKTTLVLNDFWKTLKKSEALVLAFDLNVFLMKFLFLVFKE